MNHDPSKVDYNSAAFHAGFAAGKNGMPSTIPDNFTQAPDCHSWLEGWLMGDCERDCQES